MDAQASKSKKYRPATGEMCATRRIVRHKEHWSIPCASSCCDAVPLMQSEAQSTNRVIRRRAVIALRHIIIKGRISAASRRTQAWQLHAVKLEVVEAQFRWRPEAHETLRAPTICPFLWSGTEPGKNVRPCHSRRASRATLRPRCANRRAMAKPMPDEAPTTMHGRVGIATWRTADACWSGSGVPSSGAWRW